MPERLRELDEAGYRVCFVTNQAGIEKLKLQPEEITTKINALIQELDIPCFVRAHYASVWILLWCAHE